MARRNRSGSKGGRPRLNRQLHTWAPRIEHDVATELREQASVLGVPYTTYLRQVLADAHGWTGDFLPGVELSAPISVKELQARTRRIRAEDCWPVTEPYLPRANITVDQSLAHIINARADELDVPYSDYLRSVLRIATGNDDRPAVLQDSLLDAAGGHRLAS